MMVPALPVPADPGAAPKVVFAFWPLLVSTEAPTAGPLRQAGEGPASGGILGVSALRAGTRGPWAPVALRPPGLRGKLPPSGHPGVAGPPGWRDLYRSSFWLT